MSQYKTEVILLTTRDWQEADRIITLLSRDYGKIVAMAYGVRRAKNHFAGTLQQFMHLDVVLAPGKNMDSIKQCDIKNPFKEVRENLDYMAYGALMLEMVNELCPERQVEPLIFDLLLSGITQLSRHNPRLVALAAAWQLLALSGFYPEYEKCISCGIELTENAYFSAKQGGGICPNCADESLLEFAVATRKFLNCLLHLDLSNPQPFTVTGLVLKQVEAILLTYVSVCLDKPLKSISFINQLSLL
ncbi:MAG: DNA repair protein RecO [Pelosinus sp.]|nr:DNA repair protein RecO [Pelosinus sp.]